MACLLPFPKQSLTSSTSSQATSLSPTSAKLNKNILEVTMKKALLSLVMLALLIMPAALASEWWKCNSFPCTLREYDTQYNTEVGLARNAFHNYQECVVESAHYANDYVMDFSCAITNTFNQRQMWNRNHNYTDCLQQKEIARKFAWELRHVCRLAAREGFLGNTID